jgi:uncharacterized protein
MTDFPCISCGLCCKNIGKDIEDAMITTSKNPVSVMLREFPHPWDETGRCEKLGDDNRCTIYEDRPDICNIRKIAEKLNLKLSEFYKHNAMSCNELLEKAGREERIPEE